MSKDSIHILKHHGSYMQTNRDIKKKAERDKSYQFMLRLKVPCCSAVGRAPRASPHLIRTKASLRLLSFSCLLACHQVPAGEVPPELFRELDDLSNRHGQGDLRATTRQAFQLHGVVKGHLKEVIAGIANVGEKAARVTFRSIRSTSTLILASCCGGRLARCPLAHAPATPPDVHCIAPGSNTYGGCGDINRNVMAPPVTFYNNPAYMYAQQYSRAVAELFKPMTQAFSELWLDGEKAASVEYYTRDIAEFNLDAVRKHDSGNGIVTGHAIEPLYGRTYLPKKFKFGFTVPGDNGIDLYINDIGCVVIMEPDGETLKGFNILVGGGMGRTHRAEKTFARAADHLGFVRKEDFFEAVKAIVAVQRDHGNREVRASARLKYLVHTLGVDDFRTLTEKYYGKKFEEWQPLPEWKYLDWMGWHEQGDGKLMLGINVEQGRIRDTPQLRIKTVLRTLVDKFDMPMTLTPSQSIILRDIKPADKFEVSADSHTVAWRISLRSRPSARTPAASQTACFLGAHHCRSMPPAPSSYRTTLHHGHHQNQHQNLQNEYTIH